VRVLHRHEARRNVIVVDASVVLDVLLRTGSFAAIERRLFGTQEILICPHLLDVEVAQVLRRYGATRELSEERGRHALDDLVAMPLARFPHEPLLPRIWQLRHNVTAYDAVYLALAESLEIPLVTRDAKLAATAGHDAVVELI
jgi:predicted nucleic acid-binding protein